MFRLALSAGSASARAAAPRALGVAAKPILISRGHAAAAPGASAAGAATPATGPVWLARGFATVSGDEEVKKVKKKKKKKQTIIVEDDSDSDSDMEDGYFIGDQIIVKKRAKKKKKDPDAPKKPSHFVTQKFELRGEIADLEQFVGAKVVSRSELSKAFWAYVKENELQRSEDKRLITLDATLKRVTLMQGIDEESMMKVQGAISKRLAKEYKID